MYMYFIHTTHASNGPWQHYCCAIDGGGAYVSSWLLLLLLLDKLRAVVL